MIYDVFDQPYRALVMASFGILGGVVYELMRPLRMDGVTWRVLLCDGLCLIWLQFCLGAGLMLSARGEMRLFALALFFSAMGAVRWAVRPLFTQLLQIIRKNQFSTGG